MKKIIVFFIIFIIITTITSLINAQQVSLSLSPPLLETTIKPGKSIMIAYNLKNYGDPTYLQLKVVSFEPKDNLGNIRLKTNLFGPVRFDLDNSDIQLERPFFLKTGETQQILLRIRIPDGAPEGDYYYTLLAETIPQTNLNGITSSQAKVSIGANILTTVTNTGIIDVKPKVVMFDVLSKLKVFNKKINLFDSFDKIPVILLLENKGKNLLKPAGEINLKNIFGHTFKYQIIPKNILSESQRLIEATPSANIENNNLPATSLILSGFFIGPYNLSTQINFGENSPTVFAKAHFFAFPFKLSALIITLLFILIYILKKLPKTDEE